MFYIVFDFMMAVIMFLFGMWFYKSEGKAANFLSGYNMKSADERKKYDENAMCKAYGKRMMFMSVPFIIGIIIDIQYLGIGCLIAWGIWFIMFVLRNLNLEDWIMWNELGISGGTAIVILIALYFVIKWAVKNGVKEAYKDITGKKPVEDEKNEKELEGLVNDSQDAKI